jgi:hypothetical protein
MSRQNLNLTNSHLNLSPHLQTRHGAMIVNLFRAMWKVGGRLLRTQHRSGGACNQWSIRYLDMDMSRSEPRNALRKPCFAPIGLDSFRTGCTETKSGAALILEVDNSMIVHNTYPPDVFPNKAKQMRKVFSAFATIVYRRPDSANAHTG